MTDIIAEAICDSERSGPGANVRLLTVRTRYPKMVHQETLRHRAIYIEDALRGDLDFSFSVSSSRAIPVRKTIEEVRSDALRAAPIFWGSEKKGMSQGAELSDDPWSRSDPYVGPDGSLISPRRAAQLQWGYAALHAANQAEKLAQIGAHKSIINRLLDPFIHVNCLMTATTPGWMNFFGLRLDRAADEIVRALAEECWKVWNESRPRKLEGKPIAQWHLPYADDDLSAEEIESVFMKDERFLEESRRTLCIKVSVARCAHLSYESFETGKRMTVEQCVALHQRLVGSVPIHASPAEHQATPDEFVVSNLEMVRGDEVIKLGDVWKNKHEAGNLGPGWRQYRKMLPGEAVAPLPEAYR